MDSFKRNENETDFRIRGRQRVVSRSIDNTAPLTSTKWRGRRGEGEEGGKGCWRVTEGSGHFDGRLFHGGTGHDRPRPAPMDR